MSLVHWLHAVCVLSHPSDCRACVVVVNPTYH